MILTTAYDEAIMYTYMYASCIHTCMHVYQSLEPAPEFYPSCLCQSPSVHKFLLSKQGWRHTAHSTQHTAHITQHPAHSTQHTVHSTQHTAHSTQHTVHSTQYTAHVTQHTAPTTKYSALLGHEEVIILSTGTDGKPRASIEYGP